MGTSHTSKKVAEHFVIGAHLICFLDLRVKVEATSCPCLFCYIAKRTTIVLLVVLDVRYPAKMVVV